MIDYKEFCSIMKTNPENLFTEHEVQTYLPIQQKLELIKIATEGGYAIDEKGDKQSFKPFCIEIDETGFATVKTLNKYLFLANIYLSSYLNVDFQDGLTVEDYDNFIKKGYQARINRLSDRASSYSIKHDVIELQNDFKLFEKMLNKELIDACMRINNPIPYINEIADKVVEAILARINSDLSPQKIESATKEMQDIIAKIEQRKQGEKENKEK